MIQRCVPSLRWVIASTEIELVIHTRSRQQGLMQHYPSSAQRRGVAGSLYTSDSLEIAAA